MNPQNFYLCPPREALCQAFVGKKLQEAPAPAAVVDRAVVKRNCRRMLEACSDLKVEFRPHTKTHKVQTVFSAVPFCLKKEPIDVCALQDP